MTDKTYKSHSLQNKNKEKSSLWEQVTKDVTPLDNKNIAKKQASTVKSASSKPKNTKPNVAPATRPQNTYTPPSLKSNETDHRTSQRLKRGKIPIEGRLDLHGKTQNEAFDALLSFIPNAYHQGKRCVLIITGKGNRQDSSAPLLSSKMGVLKQKTPEWLRGAPLNEYVLKIETARQNHGGEGALYVLLRRKR
ncbi:MAG: hypothetical protein COA45_06340 [Zetaproteobacteria bacterium]|nr:MAG: hypothetical protein COA45_06340 [Zetaproteobacteria bacterium]